MLEGIILVCVGAVLSIFHKTLVRDRIAFQKHHFNLKIGAKAVRIEEVALLVVGVVLILLGVLTIIGVVKFS